MAQKPSLCRIGVAQRVRAAHPAFFRVWLLGFDPRSYLLQSEKRRYLSSLGRLGVGDTDDEPLAEGTRGAGDGIQSHGDVARVKQAIQLRPAGTKLPGHGLLCFLLLVHGSLELPGQNALDGNGLDFFANAFLLQEAIEGGPAVVQSLASFVPG